MNRLKESHFYSADYDVHIDQVSACAAAHLCAYSLSRARNDETEPVRPVSMNW